jgi:hypothetical protein
MNQRETAATPTDRINGDQSARRTCPGDLANQRKVRGQGVLFAVESESCLAQSDPQIANQFAQGLRGGGIAGPKQMVVAPVAETINVDHERRCLDHFRSLNQQRQSLIRNFPEKNQRHVNGFLPRGLAAEFLGAGIGDPGQLFGHRRGRTEGKEKSHDSSPGQCYFIFDGNFIVFPATMNTPCPR